MYQYFLGNRCNHTGTIDNSPTVIETNCKDREQIEQWLDSYFIDLDELIDAVVSNLGIRISKISFQKEGIFSLLSPDNQLATLELLNEEIPKCKVKTRDKELTINLSNGALVESSMETIDGITLGKDNDAHTIRLGNKQTFIVIEFDSFNESLYYAIKRNVKRLEKWENIASLMMWMKKLPVEIPTYDMAITSLDNSGYFITKIYVVHDRIFKYSISNINGEYEVEYDGTWKAQHDVFEFNYNKYENDFEVIIPKKTLVNLEYYFSSLRYVKDFTRTMLRVLQLINDSIEHIEKVEEAIK